MTRRRFRRLPIALRLLMLALVALGMTAQPLLGALGDVHQAAHDIAVQDQPAHDHFDSDDHDADMGHALGTPPVLHDLLHIAHCCGHTIAVELVATVLPAFVAPQVSPAPRSVASRHELRRLAPFRPPITA